MRLAAPTDSTRPDRSQNHPEIEITPIGIASITAAKGAAVDATKN
jgi:hypothetical protein